MGIKTKYFKIVMILKALKKNPSLLKQGYYTFKKEGAKNTLLKVKQFANNRTSSIRFESNGRFEKLPFSPLVAKDRLNVAVVTHIFYIDLLDEIIGYVKNINPKPKIFISISSRIDDREVAQVLHKQGFNDFKIVNVENRGRDIAPFLVEFAKELKHFDLCCKIHGKKSLYTGSQKDEWRGHLCDNLLGSKDIANDIISKFSNDEKVGLVFSDNFGMIPYWGYTWLTNKIEVRKLMEKLKINDLSFLLNQTYIDYPAGTMFWFRPNAITQILDANFKYSDFPPEPIANDGTIAHALERLFGYVARLNGYHFYEVNYSRGLFTKDFCHKNFNQLEAKTLNTAKDMVSLNDCVLFDIFDTLITRTLYAPDNLFRLMEFKIDKKFGVKSNFFELRKSVEGILRAKLPEGRDVCYGEIYDGMHINCRLDLKLIAFAKDLEFELELKVTRAKNEVVELLNFAKDSGKKLILVSDMYLEQAQISSLLEKAGINIDGILLKISSQTGLRKDNAKIWKNLCETNFIDPTKAIAIGDNEVSDAKIPGDFGIKSFHLLSEKNLFLESNIGKSFFERFKSVSDANMIIFGPIVKHLFNSPFYKSDTVINFSKKFTPYEFGLVAMAPFLYVWMSYIYAKHKNNKIFFLSRDGYFLKEIFEHFLETKNLELKQEAKYLLVSRRAVMGAHKKDENSLKNMIYDLGDFNGKFSELIHNRMGLNTDFLDKASTKDFSIKTKDDMDKAYTILVKNIDIVNLYAQDERKNYMRYLEKSGFFDNDLNVLIDLGYSGTIQNYTHKLTDKKMIGEYLVTTKKVKDLESQENEMIGFFGDKVEGYYDNMIFKYSLILEAYFTSDEGQLINFDNTISPVFKDYSGSICIQKEITEGIKDYISELGMVDYDFLANNSQVKDMSIFMFEYIINKRLMDENLRKIFFIEDDFTGKGSLDILNLLYQRGI